MTASTLNMEFNEEFAVGFNFGELQFTGSMWTDLDGLIPKSNTTSN